MSSEIVRELINLIGFEINDSQWDAAEKRIDKILNKMQSFGQKGVLYLTAPFALFSGLTLKLAGDAQEIENLFNQTFGSISDETRKWSDQFSSDLNKVESKTEDTLATFQAMSTGLGAGRKEAAEFSKEIVTLANDFQSARNLSDDETLRRFVSGLSGSVEVFDRFGINLRKSALELQLLENGFKGSFNEATELQKVIARKDIIKAAMGRQGVIGDAQRTMWQFTNALRAARNQVQRMLIQFGKLLIPVAEKVLKVFIKLTKYLNEKVSKELKLIIFFMFGLAASLPPLVLGFTILAKAGMAFVTVLRAIRLAAIAANTPLALMVLKFALIGAAVLLVVAAIALVTEDIIKWVKGQPSLVGEFLGAWAPIGKKLAEFMEPIFIQWDKLKDHTSAILKTIGLFFEHTWKGNTEYAILQLEDLMFFLERWVEDVDKIITPISKLFLKAFITIFDTLGAALQKYLDNLSKVMTTMLINMVEDFMTRMDTAIDNGVKRFTKGFGNVFNDVKGFLGFDSNVEVRKTNISQEAIQRARNAGNSKFSNFRSNKNEVNTTVNITVPAGTSDRGAKIIKEGAEKTFNETLDTKLNDLLSATSRGN